MRARRMILKLRTVGGGGNDFPTWGWGGGGSSSLDLSLIGAGVQLQYNIEMAILNYCRHPKT